MVAFRVRPGSPTRALDVQVARYAQQAVLTANIEEARYRMLAASDGKVLVQMRLAVRNNQRSFLKIALPPGASVWSSSIAGRAVKAGQSPDGALLFPLPKSRAGEEAPIFAVEVLYLSRAAAWEPKGKRLCRCPTSIFLFRGRACCCTILRRIASLQVRAHFADKPMSHPRRQC